MSADPTILLVEDNDDDILFLRRACMKAGLNTLILEAYDGEEAIDLLRGNSSSPEPSSHPRPTHVLLDLKLPKKSGLEVLEWIRGQTLFRDLRVIVLTSSQEQTDIERARELGVDEYCVKPVSFPELIGLVRRIAERWQLPLTQEAH